MMYLIRAVSLGAALFVATGCYRYTPVTHPMPGMEVRAQLRAEAAARRSEGLDEPVLAYQGILVGIAADTLDIDVVIARSSSAFADVTLRDTVRLPRSEVQSLMERSVSPARTALFVVGAGAAAFAVVRGIEQVVGGTDDDLDRDPPPTSMRVPFGWPISWLLQALSRR